MADQLESTEWSLGAIAYAKVHGIDVDAVTERAGRIEIINCHFHGNGFFDYIGPRSEPAVTIECLAEDYSTVMDIVAWPIGRPERFATLDGYPALGMANVVSPTTWSFGGVLRVYRRPLEWLQDGCRGCVPLHHQHVSCWLGQALGPIEAEDLAHAEQVHRWLNPRFPRRSIFIPEREIVQCPLV